MTETATEVAAEKGPEPIGTDLALRDSGLQDLARLGTWLAASEGSSNPKGNDGMTAALRLYYAQQLDLPPMAANDLIIIKGRLFIQANVLRALAARKGYRVDKVDSTYESCTAVLYLHDEEIGRETYTLDQAQKAGIVRDKSAWNTHPDRMLWARASSFVIRDYAPEVALGIGTTEEMGDWVEGEAVEVPEPEEPKEAA